MIGHLSGEDGESKWRVGSRYAVPQWACKTGPLTIPYYRTYYYESPNMHFENFDSSVKPEEASGKTICSMLYWMAGVFHPTIIYFTGRWNVSRSSEQKSHERLISMIPRSKCRLCGWLNMDVGWGIIVWYITS